LARTVQLLLGDDRLASTTSAARFGNFQPGARTLADRIALELSERAEA
jgi:hypothetical protein